MRVPPELRRALREQGLGVVAGAFGAAEIAEVSAALDRVEARARGHDETLDIDGARFVIAPTGSGGAPAVQRVVWCGAAEPALLERAADPRILGVAGALLGVDEVDQLVNQAHFKRPGDGVEFPLHQDAWNRRYGTDLWTDEVGDGGYMQVVLTVDAMTEANGPLLYVPGSHRLGPYLGEDREERVAAAAAATPPRPVVAPAGSLVFFGPFVIHGSAPNAGSGPRRILVNGFARVGANRRRYPGAGLGLRRAVP